MVTLYQFFAPGILLQENDNLRKYFSFHGYASPNAAAQASRAERASAGVALLAIYSSK